MSDIGVTAGMIPQGGAYGYGGTGAGSFPSQTATSDLTYNPQTHAPANISLTGHYAEYTMSYSLPNSSFGQVIGTWTKVTDTDNILSSNGTFTIPTNLGGVWIVTGFLAMPSAAYAGQVTFQETHNGSQVAYLAVSNSGTNSQGLVLTWTGKATATDTFTWNAFQGSGSAQTVTGTFTIARISNA